MSRSTQFIGHTFESEQFISQCKDLGKIGKVEGMFSEHVADLHKYEDVLGDVWEEFVQAEPWSSGLMIFLGLKNGDIVKGWTEAPSDNETVDHENGTYWA